MKVILLAHEAVFANAGSYVIIPKSESCTLICRKSIGRIVSFLIGISYFFPVRLSMMESVSRCSPAGTSLGASAADFVGFIAWPLPDMANECSRSVYENQCTPKEARRRTRLRSQLQTHEDAGQYAPVWMNRTHSLRHNVDVKCDGGHRFERSRHYTDGVSSGSSANSARLRPASLGQ